MTLGEAVRRLRKERDWTQEDLERESGIKQGMIANIETGRQDNPTEKTLRRLAAAFKISVEDLLRAAGKMPPAAPAITPPLPPHVAEALQKYAPQFKEGDWRQVVGYLDRLAEERAPYTPAVPDDEKQAQ